MGSPRAPQDVAASYAIQGRNKQGPRGFSGKNAFLAFGVPAEIDTGSSTRHNRYRFGGLAGALRGMRGEARGPWRLSIAI